MTVRSQIDTPKHRDVPQGMPRVAWHDGLGDNTFSAPTSINDTQQFRKAYYSAVSYTDSLIGTVLQELRRLDLDEDTIVTLHGDHGWQLGEHNLWKKMTNFELGVRVPLIMRVPWKHASINTKTTAFFEAADLHRTLVALAGLPEPESSVQGQNLAEVFSSPPTSGAGPRNYTFSQFAKADDEQGNPFNVCSQCHRDQIKYMGLSVRSDSYRYTEWHYWDQKSLQPIWNGTLAGVELYSHVDDPGTDFDCCENVNMAQDPNMKHVVDELSVVLADHFTHDQ